MRVLDLQNLQEANIDALMDKAKHFEARSWSGGHMKRKSVELLDHEGNWVHFRIINDRRLSKIELLVSSVDFKASVMVKRDGLMHTSFQEFLNMWGT